MPYGGAGFVSGIEADIRGVAGSGSSGNRAATVNTDDLGDPASLRSTQRRGANPRYFGAVRGRFGSLVTPTLLVYGTGGLAYGGVSLDMSNCQSRVDQSGGNFSAIIAGNDSCANTQVAWTAGGGLEWMFLPNSSAEIEYLSYDPGQVSGSFVNAWRGLDGNADVRDAGSITNFSTRASGDIVRAGMNYHVNRDGAPVVTKY